MPGMPMMRGMFSCASCHGPDSRGRQFFMHMSIIEAPDIRWSALAGENGDGHDDGDEHGEYNLDVFRQAITFGRHPDGEFLNLFMPRWLIGNQDLADLAEYLQDVP